MTIPWTVHHKTTFEKVVDIVAFAADVASIANRIPDLPADKILSTALEILSKMSDIYAKMQKFYSELENTHHGPLYWEQPRPARPSSAGNNKDEIDIVFPPALCFPDLQLAATITTYWALLTMFWAGLEDLHGLFHQFGMTHVFHATMSGHTNHLTPEIMQFSWQDKARKVCQSVAYFTTSEALESGPPRVGTQLSIVIDIMKTRKGCEAEYAWAVRAREQMGTKWLRVLRVAP